MSGSASGAPRDGAAVVAPDLRDDAQLWLLRHGETQWSVSGQHTGVTDIPLTAEGEQQAKALPAVLGDLQPALVLCSPRARALDTARLAGLHVDETTDDLAEWDYGAYEGRTTADIRKEVPDWTLWTHGVPDGESAAQVGERADRVLARAAQALADGPVVLIGHGHFSRVLGARWIGSPVAAGAHLLLGTAGASLLGAQYGQPVLVHWNLPNPAAEK